MTRGASRTITAHRERGGVRLAAYRTLVRVFCGFQRLQTRLINIFNCELRERDARPRLYERILCVCGEWSVWRAARSVGR